jgi:hypothetical protein
MLLARLAAAAVLAGSIAALAPPAAGAATGSFTCQASAARVSLTGAPTLDPFVANAGNSPCVAEQRALVSPTTVGPLTIQALTVNTGVDQNGATARARVTSPALGQPLPLSADVLDASVTYTCVNGRPEASSTSTVVGLVAAAQTFAVPPGGAPLTVPLGPLGTLDVNKTLTSGNTLTRQALSLTTPLGTVVISEASVGFTGNPCAAAPSTPSRPATPSPGTARLTTKPNVRGIGRCVRGSFRAIVTGRHIRSVTFRRDGHKLATDGKKPFTTLVRAHAGRHRLTARVTFTAASGTSPRTLSLRYLNCARAPVFTG